MCKLLHHNGLQLPKITMKCSIAQSNMAPIEEDEIIQGPNEINEVTKENKPEPSTSKTPTLIKAYVPPIPQPQILQKLSTQFCKFLEVFKKLHNNIPFLDALAQMLCYAKFISNKIKLEKYEMVVLKEECSAIL